MSTTTTINLDHCLSATAGKPSFFSRLVKAREAAGAASVRAYFARQSDETLAGLGFKPDQVAHIRAHGTIPASFWR